MSRERVNKAFEAMKALGISAKVVKPVLKNLLQLYDKNWELIEEENYRVLADAIFELEDSKEAEAKKPTCEQVDAVENRNKEAWVDDGVSPPRMRLRSRPESDNSSPSLLNGDMATGEPSPKRPKLDGAVSLHSTVGQEENGLVSPHAHDRGQRTDPVTASTVVAGKRPDALPQTCMGDKRTDSFALQAYLRDKRTEASSRDRRPALERVANAICLKEPKPEPGVEHLQRSVVPADRHSKALIEPKPEPITDEEPIAMIRPQVPFLTRSEGQISKEVMTRAKSPKQTNTSEASSSPHVGARTENGTLDTCQNGANLELVNVPEASSANFEIASSASGEVKLSLTCNYERSDFHMPSLDEVLKLVEDKCLRSYKIIEPSFSVKRLMQELCQCFLELGTDSSNGNQESCKKINPTFDVLKKTDNQNMLGAQCAALQGNFNCSGSSSNGSSDSRYCPKVLDSQVTRLLSVNGPDGSCQNGHPSEGAFKDCDTAKDPRKTEVCSEAPKNESHDLVTVKQSQFSFGDVRPLHDVNDIAKGEERIRIPLVNEVTSEQYPTSFYYVPQTMVYQNAHVNFSLARIGDENCCSDCFGDCLSSLVPCACARETGGEYAYTLDGLLKKEFLDECISMNRDPQKHHQFYCKECPVERFKNDAQPVQCKGHLVRKFIKECWSKCGCNKQCGNRVVQRGLMSNLQVFFTSEGKGWGLRTLEELPRGTFVCEYVGEVLTNTELYNRNMKSIVNEKHHYPIFLDAGWGLEGDLEDKEPLCLDATFYGNVARFINHRCSDANLIAIPVEVETPDHNYYHVAFFTIRNIEAFDELTWDYGIDFNDDNRPVKAFRCRCGSEFCRDIKRTKRAKPGALVLK